MWRARPLIQSFTIFDIPVIDVFWEWTHDRIDLQQASDLAFTTGESKDEQQPIENTSRRGDSGLVSGQHGGERRHKGTSL